MDTAGAGAEAEAARELAVDAMLVDVEEIGSMDELDEFEDDDDFELEEDEEESSELSSVPDVSDILQQPAYSLMCFLRESLHC